MQCNNKSILPPDDKPKYTQCISLTADEIRVTEAWLKVKFTDTTVNRSFKIVRDGQTTFTGRIVTSTDTVLLDKNLLPNHIYKYKALRLVDAVAVDSVLLDVPTMDITSHEFTWQVDTVSTGSTCVVNDVFIVNDTCVYIVGQLNELDSLGKKKGGVYGVGIWNGQKWKTVKLNDEQNDPIVPLRGITVFGNTDIWFAAGSVYRWDGVSLQATLSISRLTLPNANATIEKIWGRSNSDIYGVGTEGTIIHYDGTNWQLMESGTDVNLTDVWGSPDGSVVWAAGYYDDKAGTYLFKYDGTNWKMMYDGTSSRSHLTPDSISGVITSVWTNSNNKVFVGAGAGIFLLEDKANWKSRLVTPLGWLRTLPGGMRGNDINDMFIVGTYGFIGHYNGSTCKQYSQFYSNKNIIYSVAQKGNLVVAVGITFGDFIFNKAVVFIGRR
jgi:uncharacterized membrane protein